MRRLADPGRPPQHHRGGADPRAPGRASTSRRSGDPAASRCCWPTSSSTRAGLIRTARGRAGSPVGVHCCQPIGVLGRLGGLVGHHPWLTVVDLARCWPRAVSRSPTAPSATSRCSTGWSRGAHGARRGADRRRTCWTRRRTPGRCCTTLLEGVDPADETARRPGAAAREDLGRPAGRAGGARPVRLRPEDPRGQAYVSTDRDAVAVVSSPRRTHRRRRSRRASTRLDTLVDRRGARGPGAPRERSAASTSWSRPSPARSRRTCAAGS